MNSLIMDPTDHNGLFKKVDMFSIETVTEEIALGWNGANLNMLDGTYAAR